MSSTDNFSWTAYGPGKIQDKISRDIKTIIECLIEEYKPLAIIITGSFGKGEGSVLELNGEFHYLSDCEMVLVDHFPVKASKLRQTRIVISEKVAIDFELFHNFPTKYETSFLSELLYHPGFVSISAYDRRYSSLTVYGKDFLKTMPNYSATDIPVWEGIRQIWVRMCGALLSYHVIDSGSVNKLENVQAAYRVSRLIQANADALLIMAGSFHHSYAERAKMARQVLPDHFPALMKSLPDFSDSLDEVITAKLLPNQMKMKNLREMWDSYQKTTDLVLRFLLDEEYGIRFGSYEELPELYLASSDATSYYRPPGKWLQNIRNTYHLSRLNCKISPMKISRKWSHELLKIGRAHV